MKRIISAIIVLAAIPVIVIAAPAPKVFVCKYVGTPGTDERLQTGQNPINVSSNAIKDYQGVGSYFNDAQGRSYVLAIDVGQAEPNVSECPVVKTPDPVVDPTPDPTPTPVPPVVNPSPTVIVPSKNSISTTPVESNPVDQFVGIK